MPEERTSSKVEQCGWCDVKTDYFRDVAPPMNMLMFACEKHRHVLDAHANQKEQAYQSRQARTLTASKKRMSDGGTTQ